MSVQLNPGKTYGQFCPISRAAEIFAERWTPLIMRELLFGCETFSDLKKGIPQISPTTLSKRLNELADAGLLVKRDRGGKGTSYQLTESGKALETVVVELGNWGHRYITDDLRDDELDPMLLMWDIRRNLDTSIINQFGTPTVIQFVFSGERPNKKYWWLVVDHRDVDLCRRDPGRDSDLVVSTHVRTLTHIWLGKLSYSQALQSKHLSCEGRREMTARMADWMLGSAFGSVS